MTTEQETERGSTRRLISLFERMACGAEPAAAKNLGLREDPGTPEPAGGRARRAEAGDAREELRRLQLARPAQESRRIFEEKIRAFAQEMQKAPSAAALGQRQGAESLRKRIAAQRREAGRNKTLVASHLTVLLQGREKDNTVLRPSALRSGSACPKRTSFEL
jgi:hypothetical protein